MNLLKNKRARNWCFTIHNPTGTWEEETLLMREHDKFGFLSVQKEKGKKGTKQGHIHFQGFVQFKSAIRGPAVKKMHAKATWSVMISTAQKCTDYTSKDDTRIDGPWQVGTMKDQGRRTDIEEAVKRVSDGDVVMKIIDDMPGCIRIRRHLQDHYIDHRNLIDRPNELTVESHWGVTCGGKTHFINTLDDVFKVKKSKCGGYWWDGYAGQKNVVFQEFNGQIQFSEFLQMTDPIDQFWGDIKGQTPIKIQASGYYFTSNKPPWEWYNFYRGNYDMGAFKRRFTKVKQYTVSHGQVPEPLMLIDHKAPDGTITERVEPMMWPKEGILQTVHAGANDAPRVDRLGFWIAKA